MESLRVFVGHHEWHPKQGSRVLKEKATEALGGISGGSSYDTPLLPGTKGISVPLLPLLGA